METVSGTEVPIAEDTPGTPGKGMSRSAMKKKWKREPCATTIYSTSDAFAKAATFFSLNANFDPHYEHHNPPQRGKPSPSEYVYSHRCKLCFQLLRIFGQKLPTEKKTKVQASSGTLVSHMEKKHTAEYVAHQQAENDRKLAEAMERQKPEVIAREQALATAKHAADEIDLGVLLPSDDEEEAALPSIIELKPSAAQATLLRAAFANWVSVDNLPSSAGESTGARTFFHTLGLDLTFGRRGVKNHQEGLEEFYLQNTGKVLAQELKFHGHRLSLSLDGMTMGPTSVLGGVINYVSALDTEVKQISLGIRELKSHKAADIALIAVEMIKDLGLVPNDISSSTCDTCASARCTARLVLSTSLFDKMSKKDLASLSERTGIPITRNFTPDMLEFALSQMPEDVRKALTERHLGRAQNCWAHICKLCLDDVLKVPNVKDDLLHEASPEPSPSKFSIISSLVARLAAVGSHANRSTMFCNAYADFQRQHGIEKPKLPSVFAPTRFTGFSDFMRRMWDLMANYKLVEFLHAYHSDTITANVKRKLVFDGSEVILVHYLASIIHPLFILTKELESQSVSQAEAYLHAMHALEDLDSTDLLVVDKDGFIRFVLGRDEQGEEVFDFKVFARSNLPEEFNLFAEALSDAIVKRLLEGELDDEMCVSLFLDKLSQEKLKLCATNPSERVAKIASDALAKLDEAEVLVAKRMAADSKKSSAVPTTEAIPASPSSTTTTQHTPLVPATRRGLNLQLMRSPRASVGNTQNKPTMHGDAGAAYHRELTAYKAYAVPKDQVENDLQQWRLIKNDYPQLYKVFLRSRAIRPTNSPVETEFTYVRKFNPAERSAQTVESINKRLVLRAAKLSPRILHDYHVSIAARNANKKREGEEED